MVTARKEWFRRPATELSAGSDPVSCGYIVWNAFTSVVCIVKRMFGKHGSRSVAELALPYAVMRVLTAGFLVTAASIDGEL